MLGSEKIKPSLGLPMVTFALICYTVRDDYSIHRVCGQLIEYESMGPVFELSIIVQQCIILPLKENIIVLVALHDLIFGTVACTLLSFFILPSHPHLKSTSFHIIFPQR